MEDVVNWFLNNIGDLALLIIYIMCTIVKNKFFKNTNVELINLFTTGLDEIKKSTEEVNERRERRQNILVNSQQKQIEENTRQIAELTKIVQKSIEKRID